MSVGSPTVLARLRRWAFVVAGVVAATVGFVGLVNAENHGHDRWPWWLVALLGTGAVLLGFGSPWGTQPPDD